nr:Xaa-Pro peptidase family protein [uncultured Cohaesibacter sp.]
MTLLRQMGAYKRLESKILTDQFKMVRGREAAFSEAEFAQRQARAQAAVEAAGHDVLLVTSPENIYWLTGRQTAGYFAFQTLLLPASGAPTLLVRQLELSGSIANCWLEDIVAYQDGEDPIALLGSILSKRHFAKVAMEMDGWFVSPKMASQIEASLPTGKLSDGSGLIAPLRMIKSPAELDAIRHAARYAEAGLAAGIDACAAGADENAVAAAMLAEAVRQGSETMAMEPLVSSGPRSGLPHMTWRRRTLELGDPLFLELAASHLRYHSALMRTVWIGQPSQEGQRMMDCALLALERALEAIKPGVPCAEPHLAAQKVIDDHGYTAAFRKRIGYSMGVAFAPDWGEGGILSLFTGIEQEIQAGMVFHLPATLRSYGEWTVGASETVIVTQSGIDILSDLPRQICIK